MAVNALSGSVWKSLVSFSIPFVISYFLQTLYGMADLVIIGQFEGPASITAVAVGSQIMHMVTVVLVGLSMGTTIAIARAVGKGEAEKVSCTIGQTLLIFGILSVVLAGFLINFLPRIVDIMATPPEAVRGTKHYLFICFLGIPLITGYNLISSIFRGLGNSRTPTYFVALAAVINLTLDLLFMGPFAMGPLGAALGTTISQGVSVLVGVFVMKRHPMGLGLSKASFVPSGSLIREILGVGIPIAVQDAFIQISFLIITMIANLRGVTDAAAVGIVEKIISFLFLVPSSLLSAVSALSAQNLGADNRKRARAYLYDAIKTAVFFGLSVSLLIQVMAPRFVGLFTSDEAVIASGGPYLKGYIFDTIFAGIHFSFSGYFCAAKKSIYSFLHNLIAIVLVRIPFVYLASRAFFRFPFSDGPCDRFGVPSFCPDLLLPVPPLGKGEDRSVTKLNINLDITQPSFGSS